MRVQAFWQRAEAFTALCELFVYSSQAGMCFTKAWLGSDCPNSTAIAAAGAGMSPKVLAAAPLFAKGGDCGAPSSTTGFSGAIKVLGTSD